MKELFLIRTKRSLHFLRMPCLLTACLAVISGCGFREPQWRVYEEVMIDGHASHNHEAAPATRPAQAVRTGALRWTAPEGWSEEKGSGMRLSTFKMSRDGAAGVCTIVTLGGAAGGIEPNVSRWIGQLKLPALSAEEMATFLNRQKKIQTAGGFEGVVVDLTELGDPSPGTESMLAAIIKVDGVSLFVKLTGPVGLIKAELEAFTKLCESVRAES